MIKFVDIRSVIPDIYDIVDEAVVSSGDIVEWCAKAMGQIGSVETYVPQIAIKEVRGFQTDLPDGLLQVNQILYKPSSDCPGCVKNLSPDDYQKLLDAYKCCANTESDLTTNLKIKSQCFLDTIPNYWAPLRASTSNFMMSVLCENSPNLTSNCENEYTIRPNGTIVTDFESGTIIISYMMWPRDDNGNIMIPYDEELIEALRLFCMTKIWERRWNRHEQGADQRFMTYKQEWGRYKNMVRGKLKLPTEDQWQNIIDYSVNLLPKKDRYYSYFGNLNVPDTTFF